MSKKTKSIILCVVFVTILVVIDQISKLCVRNCFGDGSDFVIWDDVLRLLFSKNSGAAWGMFKDKTWILACLSLVMSLAMFICYCKLPNTKRFNPLKISLIFVIAGAIGNGIDRFIFQYVTDFIYFELINFPIFNVADIYITCSMFFLVFLLLFYYKDEDFDFIKSKKNEVKEAEVIEEDNEDLYQEDDTEE